MERLQAVLVTAVGVFDMTLEVYWRHRTNIMNSCLYLDTTGRLKDADCWLLAAPRRVSSSTKYIV